MKDFRNIAIIAHVDHGKTTLVDAMLKQSGTFNERDVIEVCVMDSNELEKERGITIYAKNTAIQIGDTKINIVDTPGHADFGSEVERVLRMVDSVLLLVDAYEGPMPQTKFVLRKSLALGLKPIVVINKIDKPSARPDVVLNMIFDLFVELGATDEQLDFKHIYAIAREGIAKMELTDESKDLQPLFDLILKTVPPAQNNTSVPMRMQPANLAYDSYIGRLAVGRIYEGTVRAGMTVTVITPDGTRKTNKITKLLTNKGLNKIEVQEAEAGDIVQIAGIPDIYVGDTIAESATAEPLPSIAIDAPTLKMDFMVNNSPFAGREGKLVTSRQIRERLLKELEVNVGMKIEFSDTADVFTVSGRGEMHLSILIEQMRREGFELQVSQPRVIFQEVNGQKQEPIEIVVVDVPDQLAGIVIEQLGKRRGEMLNMQSENGNTRLEYHIPTRGLLGYQSEFVTSTKGEGTLSHQFAHYGEYKGEIERRSTGSIINGFDGITTPYALEGLEARGVLFVGAGAEVYEGMVIGMSMKDNIVVNAIREKKLTNMRSAGADMAVKLTPALDMTLERALEYIDNDELVEVTPKTVRIRKKYLKEFERKKHGVA
ncbi:GTP-binding protein TypA [Candidatus Uhrbacteria bacterium RIFCSPHIGHO2_02_FULL_47_44]|uniref:Large ribosomal subunit assembly factor BipA n=1 Tax=Candidatus Uhrbacteria bacterium RIFCSPLOWO2_02_FULL_48_18 TaxID=1802408 RepID=A0A1F7V958_9BACT|nr:MAG: GTP-binding protein TypA [Candidatus Uhrbacteria bacterium RIFCSPHIGHO2_02_FULL_47_44]OGL77488.1 MAG: GTP-binding protein TypA [Candidatus Uhrbacteria bacterium RIFCSPHIGHO2_12_FULL_47_12]OGL81850.1 MAG: GTP-binding protein TypA [Candidatus Uhrbacteria bacterium RIFCSPLOWO2_01_FULL_47_17]OGL87013.1 MAG: GTP-binding protein TypA [Candidatus Uhrbacteria bacterium RIFCSPLOWO2_02_FULL_48_18]OGL94487.1 MAG: GTP-binding protein TypA [Candidatus Uhrbacteria bacterium RIFCSPLOWO2_12_FULL_47_9]